MAPNYEIRAPLAVKADPTTFIPRGQPQYPVHDPNRYYDEAYYANMYVWRAVTAIADDVSALPFRAGRDPDHPQKFQSPSYSRLAYLLSPPPGSPNPQWTPRMLWRHISINYTLLGKFALWKERTPSGQLIALWPLMVQHLRPIYSKDASNPNYFARFEYGIRGSDGYREFTPDEILYFYCPSARNFLYPESPLQAGAINIDIATMLDTYDYSFLKNNATPSTLITTEEFREPEMRKAFRDEFMALHGGSHNAGSTMFLEASSDIDSAGNKQGGVQGKVSVARLGLTAEEAQHSEQRAAVIDDILTLFKVPRSVIGVASGNTFANAAAEQSAYWRNTIVPHLAALKDAVNLHLAPELDGGRYLGWWDLSSVRPLRSVTFEGADLIKAMELGILTPDEGRADLGKVPLGHDPIPLASATPVADNNSLVARPARPDNAPPTNPDTKNPAAPTARPKAPATRPPNKREQPLRDLLATTIAQILDQQHRSLLAGRRGQQAASHPTTVELDLAHHEQRALQTLRPVLTAISAITDVPVIDADLLAMRIVAETQVLLSRSSDIDDAFVKPRAARIADSVFDKDVDVDLLSVTISTMKKEELWI